MHYKRSIDILIFRANSSVMNIYTRQDNVLSVPRLQISWDAFRGEWWPRLMIPDDSPLLATNARRHTILCHSLTHSLIQLTAHSVSTTVDGHIANCISSKRVNYVRLRTTWWNTRGAQLNSTSSLYHRYLLVDIYVIIFKVCAFLFSF